MEASGRMLCDRASLRTQLLTARAGRRSGTARPGLGLRADHSLECAANAKLMTRGRRVARGTAWDRDKARRALRFFVAADNPVAVQPAGDPRRKSVAMIIGFGRAAAMTLGPHRRPAYRPASAWNPSVIPEHAWRRRYAAASYIFNIAPKDGTVLGISATRRSGRSGATGARFDPTRLSDRNAHQGNECAPPITPRRSNRCWTL